MNSFRLGIYTVLIAWGLHPAMAQNQDFVILSSQDTVYGKVAISIQDKTQVDKLIVKTDDGRTLYNSLQAITAHINGDIYTSVKYQEKYHYMKVKSSGYVSQFLYRPENSTIFSALILKKMDGTLTEIPLINFKKLLAEFASDCNSVSNDMEQGKYKRKDLNQFVSDYNDCIQSKTGNSAEGVPGFNSPSIGTLTLRFIESINASELEEKNELIDIIQTIAKRADQGEEIPEYLRSALYERVKGNSQWKAWADELINQ